MSVDTPTVRFLAADGSFAPTAAAEPYRALVDGLSDGIDSLVTLLDPLNAPLATAVRQRYDVTSLRFVSHGAAPCAPAVKRQMIEWWGPVINEYYGATETGVVVWHGSEEALRKPGTVEEIIRTVERLARHNIIIYCSFIVGAPAETLEDLRETVKLIFRLHQINPNVRTSPLYNYTPYPGTQMYTEAIQAGFQPPSSLEDWADMSFETCTRVWKKQWDEAFLQSLYLTSLMVDRKAEEYSESRLMRLAAKMYRPVARFRLKHLYFGAMAERLVAQRMLSPKLV